MMIFITLKMRNECMVVMREVWGFTIVGELHYKRVTGVMKLSEYKSEFIKYFYNKYRFREAPTYTIRAATLTYQLRTQQM